VGASKNSGIPASSQSHPAANPMESTAPLSTPVNTTQTDQISPLETAPTDPTVTAGSSLLDGEIIFDEGCATGGSGK